MQWNAIRARRVAWLLASGPAWAWGFWIATEQLGANPVERLEHSTGFWALVGLCISLSVTPLRKLTGWSWLGPLRRTFGLFGFAYATVHVAVYLVLDRSLWLTEIVVDLTKRPYVMLGASAWVLLSVMALTSPKWVVRRLGGPLWRRVHWAAYVATPLACAHFAWMKWDKNLLTRPAWFAAGVSLLLLMRLYWVARDRRL